MIIYRLTKNSMIKISIIIDITAYWSLYQPIIIMKCKCLNNSQAVYHRLIQNWNKLTF